jgi:hypothetical protein
MTSTHMHLDLALLYEYTYHEIEQSNRHIYGNYHEIICAIKLSKCEESS